MKQIIFLIFTTLFVSTSIHAQNDYFKGRFDNNELGVFIVINLYDKNITIPGQDYLGKVVGYIDDKLYSRKWIIIDGTVKNPTTAEVEIINEEGSEDLKASLSYDEKEKTITLTQKSGSTIKVVRNRKWKKLPEKVVFTFLT